MSLLPYSTELLNEAKRLGAATLFEASRMDQTAVDPAIRSLWPGAAIAGPAYPVHCAPGDNLAIHIAMDKPPRGSVLVVSAQGFIAGYWGEVLTVAAEAAGIIGLVMDGGVRDVGALTARRFPVFTRGVSVRGTLKASAPSVGQAISLAGTPVAKGDLVVADDDGVVILPAAMAVEMIERGRARAEKEAAMMEALQSGRTTMDLLGLQR